MCEYFVNSSHLTNIIPIPIPIPIRTEVGSAKLFLLLFAREKKLFADHWAI